MTIHRTDTIEPNYIILVLKKKLKINTLGDIHPNMAYIDKDGCYINIYKIPIWTKNKRIVINIPFTLTVMISRNIVQLTSIYNI